jgi:hypothetical protein
MKTARVDCIYIYIEIHIYTHASMPHSESTCGVPYGSNNRPKAKAGQHAKGEYGQLVESEGTCFAVACAHAHPLNNTRSHNMDPPGGGT